MYVLFSEKTGKYYTWMSENIERRLEEHNAWWTHSTKTWCPWEIVYTEQVWERVSARQREKYLKSGIWREYIKKLLHEHHKDI